MFAGSRTETEGFRAVLYRACCIVGNAASMFLSIASEGVCSLRTWEVKPYIVSPYGARIWD